MSDRESLLREQAEKIAEEYHYKDSAIQIEAISSGGANYTSTLYNITICASNNETLHLFAKVTNFNKSSQSVFHDSNMFDAENFMYRNLANKFKMLEIKCEIPDNERYLFPKFYCYNPKEYEETFILENLMVKGYQVYDRLKSIDWPYASKAVDTLAKFHALSMAYGEENPEEYNKALTEVTNNIEPLLKTVSNNFPKFVETALSVTTTETKRKRLQTFCDRECFTGNIISRFCKHLRKPVFIHGDYRQSNIMHKIREDGTIDLIPVDYQTIQSGSCVADLLYFIFTGSDAQFRVRYYQCLVDHYYDSLRKALQRLRLDPNKVYSREDFDLELRMVLPYGLIMAIVVLPIVTVESEDAPNLNGEDFIDRLSKPKTSKYYPERMNGVIDDFVKWGVL